MSKTSATAKSQRTPNKGRGDTRATDLGPAMREPSLLKVRPYLLTGGRTRSEVDLPLEATLITTEEGTTQRRTLTLERLSIVDTCAEPVPVVELAARLGLPLQVVRVLVGDLIAERLMELQTAPQTTSERPDLALLERVLDGLQNL
ncbi:MAG: DUF742 domain-containing protein [Acidimicrobiia bacterium]|nr:DUF742 domain-containing protein [Acidimicrobiia bacterium]